MNTTNADYFTFNAHNSLLLFGKSGSGKSYMVHKLIERYTTALSPDQLQLALFDMKRIEYVLSEDLQPVYPYLMFDVVLDAVNGLDRLEELVKLSEDRVKNGTTSSLVLVHVDECDMAYVDAERFDKALITLNRLAKEANMKIIYSTSKRRHEAISDKLASSFELVLTGFVVESIEKLFDIEYGTKILDNHEFMVLERTHQ